jgi:hypothetical protein
MLHLLFTRLTVTNFKNVIPSVASLSRFSLSGNGAPQTKVGGDIGPDEIGPYEIGPL